MDADEKANEEVDVIAIPRAWLQAFFDLAVNSMDFGSGFWDDEEVRIARRVAALIGVDPIEATPSNYRKRIAHEFKRFEANGGRIVCAHCREAESAEVHLPDEEVLS